MTALLCMLTAAALSGVEAGWQPLDSGGLEYIILIDPESAEELKTKGVVHDISPKAADIRRIIVFVGQGNLPTDAGKLATGKRSPIKDPAKVIRISAQSIEQLERDGLLYEVPDAERDAGRVELFIGPPPRTNPTRPNVADPASNGSKQRPAGTSTTADEGPSFGHTDDKTASAIPMTPVAPNPPDDGQPSAAKVSKAPEKSSVDPGMPPWAQEGSFQPNKKSPFADKSPPMKTQTAALDKTKRPQELSPSDIQPKETSPTEKPKSKAAVDTATESESSRPWLPFTVSLLALFASVGANVYLGWLHLESRAKYRRLLERLQTETSTT